jgi:hypothetical protein
MLSNDTSSPLSIIIRLMSLRTSSSFAATNAVHGTHQPEHQRLDAGVSGVFPYSSSFSIVVSLTIPP